MLTITNFPVYSLRQYPLFSKSTPPAVLADHFTPQVFEKSQNYGKHKAKFSIVVGLYKQFIDTLQIASGLYYPWAWRASGQLLGLAGYGSEYLVRPEACARWNVV
jgi:STE24 endopeptidase